MNNSEDLSQLVHITGERADEIIQLCYKKIADIKHSKESDHSIQEVIEYMNTIGTTDGERFFAGFIFGRIYQNNIAECDVFERTGESMFG
jgi:hypothetical protein